MIKEAVKIKNEENGFRYKFNQFTCIAMCVWMMWPYFRARVPSFIFLAVFGLWLLSTDLKWLSSKWTKDLYFIVIFFATFIPYIITGSLSYGLSGPAVIYRVFPIFFVGMFFNYYYMYYKKDYNVLRKIAIVSFGTYIIGSLQTFYGLTLYPNAARELAGGIWNRNEELAFEYQRLGIGSYGYIYAGCFLLIVAMYPIIVRSAEISKLYRVISVVVFVVTALVILKASYMTALIFSFLGIVMVLAYKNKGIFIFTLILTIIFLLVMPQDISINLLLKLSSLFGENQKISAKFAGLAISMMSGTLEGTTSRVSLYLASLSTFVKHPLFGIYGPFGGGEDPTSRFVIGYHSGWLDQLGFYGLFTGIPMFAAIFINIKKHLNFYRHNKYRDYIVVTSFMFLLLGLVNPVPTIIEIGFMFFFIIPIIPFLQKDFTPEVANQTTSGDGF